MQIRNSLPIQQSGRAELGNEWDLSTPRSQRRMILGTTYRTSLELPWDVDAMKEGQTSPEACSHDYFCLYIFSPLVLPKLALQSWLHLNPLTLHFLNNLFGPVFGLPHADLSLRWEGPGALLIGKLCLKELPEHTMESAVTHQASGRPFYAKKKLCLKR